MEKTDRPLWATDLGLPSAHLVHAALHAGRLIDSHGSALDAVDLAYVIYPSDGLFPPEDLRIGLALLVDCGLVVHHDNRVRPVPRLLELVALPFSDAAAALLSLVFERIGSPEFDEPMVHAADNLVRSLVLTAEQREAMLIALGDRHDEAADAATGTLGEDFVVEQAKAELRLLGLDNLVAGVRRVSLVSNVLGYDVVAPGVQRTRRIEVKTSRSQIRGIFPFYLSRSEFDWGQKDVDWALVGCRADRDALTLLGWCRAAALTAYLPQDALSGHWESARVLLPEATLQPGLPPPI